MSALPKWIKPEKRSMSNQFKCPCCGRIVYCICPSEHHIYTGEMHTVRRVNICNYPACPWCKETIYGSEV